MPKLAVAMGNRSEFLGLVPLSTAFIQVLLNKKPGDSAFSNESVANYTLGRAETRVDKGALVAGQHALPSPRRDGGRGRRKQCGHDGGHADNIMELGNVATKWLQLRRFAHGGEGKSALRWTDRWGRMIINRNRCPIRPHRDFRFDQIYAISRCAIKADDKCLSSKSSSPLCDSLLQGTSICYSSITICAFLATCDLVGGCEVKSA